jgi:hypothetical protein
MVLCVFDRPLSFQAHFILMQKFFLLKAITCVPHFEQLVESGIDRLHESILEILHNHSFTCIISYLFFDSQLTCLKSFVRPTMGIWLLTRLVIPFFRLHSNVFSTTLHIRLGHSHHLILKVSHCICN